MAMTALDAFYAAQDRNRQIAGEQDVQTMRAMQLLPVLENIRKQRVLEQMAQMAGGDPEKLMSGMLGIGDLGGAAHLAQIQDLQQKAVEHRRKNDLYSPANLQQFMIPGAPAQAPGQGQTGGIDDGALGQIMSPAPAQPGGFDLGRFTQAAAAAGVVSPEALLNHQAQIDVRREQIISNAQLREREIQRRSEADARLAANQEEANAIRRDAIQQSAELKRLTLAQLEAQRSTTNAIAQGNLDARRESFDRPHMVIGVDPKTGQQTVSWVKPSEGPKTLDSKPTGLVNNDQISLRQVQNAMTATIKPDVSTLDNYARYQALRESGDNSQANQLLASTLLQMSRGGNRVFSKEAETILGTEFGGGSLFQRMTNFTSQLASGKRSSEIDAKLNGLAEAMAKASADRIGDEIRTARETARSRTLNPDMISGTRIYGNRIISPEGNVYTFKSAAEARQKFSEFQQQGQQ